MTQRCFRRKPIHSYVDTRVDTDTWREENTYTVKALYSEPKSSVRTQYLIDDIHFFLLVLCFTTIPWEHLGLNIN